MIDLGLYTRHGRTDEELIREALEDCNTTLTEGFVVAKQKMFGVDIRYYETKARIPDELVGLGVKIFMLSKGKLSREDL